MECSAGERAREEVVHISSPCRERVPNTARAIWEENLTTAPGSGGKPPDVVVMPWPSSNNRENLPLCSDSGGNPPDLVVGPIVGVQCPPPLVSSGAVRCLTRAMRARAWRGYGIPNPLPAAGILLAAMQMVRATPAEKSGRVPGTGKGDAGRGWVGGGRMRARRAACGLALIVSAVFLEVVRVMR